MVKGNIFACEPAVKGFVVYQFSKQFAEVIVSLEKRNILYSQTFKRVAVWRISKQIINKRFAWINDAWLYCLYYPSGNLNIKGWVSIFSSSLVKPKKVIFSRYQFFCSSIESHVGQARNMSIGEHRQFFALNSFDSTRFIEPLGWEPVLTMLCHF